MPCDHVSSSISWEMYVICVNVKWVSSDIYSPVIVPSNTTGTFSDSNTHLSWVNKEICYQNLWPNIGAEHLLSKCVYFGKHNTVELNKCNQSNASLTSTFGLKFISLPLINTFLQCESEIKAKLMLWVGLEQLNSPLNLVLKVSIISPIAFLMFLKATLILALLFVSLIWHCRGFITFHIPASKRTCE